VHQVRGEEASGSGRLACVQVRGDVVPGRQREHASRMAAWAAGAGVGRVVVLASTASQFVRAREEGSGPALGLSYACSGPDAEAWAGKCESLGFRPLAQDEASDRPPGERRTQPWPLLAELGARGVPATALFAVASEADNTPDGIRMAEGAARLLGLPRAPGDALARLAAAWPPPLSWRALYGYRPGDLS